MRSCYVGEEALERTSADNQTDTHMAHDDNLRLKPRLSSIGNCDDQE